MEAPEIVKDLVEKFKNNIDSYKNTKYNETSVRQEFIDPLFIALGWDVNNEAGWAPQYREVILEDAIKIDGKTKAPDYSFTLHGQRIFFLEAKKPAVNIENDKSPAFQLKRYAWSGKLALSVLTDFEHLAIYEAKSRPKKTDSTKIGRVKLYSFKDYVDKWDEIYNLLSKEAVLKGSFDRFASKKVKKGTSEVDDEFLKEIENWRLKLARNIALRNKELSVEDLNYAVQLTIDRIIFLRIAEDRGIEPYKQLYKILDKDNIYNEFGKLCHKADAKYNSGLFHFKEEKEISQAADTFTLELNIDNGVFKEIIKDLYYPNSPYEFSVLSPEILGNVYEQFLGKVIRLTPSNQAKVEDKPEVKKAGGVFYTPQYIVDYIVENTVGKLCEGKTPNQVAKLRIVDPACGSGSFLLGAYNYLLKWHIDYYSNLEKHPKDTIYQSKNGKWHLTIQKKKEILTNNIYGVDIDFKAVEVSKLSLLLKVLEDENKDALEQQQKLIQERVLPYLGDNIRCGNSLIGTDILEEDLDSEEIAKINPFDWEEEFSEIFENGGFDAVIGNPPYVRQERIKEIKPYLKYSYETYDGLADLYVYFFEKGLNILNENGYLSYICSDKFTKANYGKKLRNYILNNSLIKFNDYKGDKIFKRATVDPCVTVIKKEKKKNNVILVSDDFKLEQDRFYNKTWSFVLPEILDLKDKILEKGYKIKDIDGIRINRGILTGYNKAFIIDEKIKNKLISKDLKNKDIIKPLLRGRDIKKWNIEYKNLYLIYVPWNIDIKKYPYIREHLLKFKDKLSKRPEVKSGRYGWYCLSRYASDYYEDFTRPKLIYPEIGTELSPILDKNKFYIDKTAFILAVENEINLVYLNVILSSKLINFLFKQIGRTLGKTGLNLGKIFIEELPIIILQSKEQKPFLDLADKLIQLNKDLANAKTPHEKKLIEKQIKVTDDKINKLVYELYDLTDEEINIIEDETN